MAPTLNKMNASTQQSDMHKKMPLAPIRSNKMPVSKELTTMDRLMIAFRIPCEVVAKEGGANFWA